MNDIQWFPGHMTKTRRMLEEQINLVDIIAEMADARIPVSSRNPLLDRLCGSKPRILILNKTDLADPLVTESWERFFAANGNLSVLKIDSRKINKNTKKQVVSLCKNILAEKISRKKEKGIRNPRMKLMIVGIPNSGKSTFINGIAGRASAATGDKPGVTRGRQWIRLDEELDLLDTPGMLWPKFEDQEIALKLAVTGAISDQRFDFYKGALFVLGICAEHYREAFAERYGLTREEAVDSPEMLLRTVAVKRGCLIRGGEPDIDKACRMIVHEFRQGKTGKISLERPAF